ncbi:MAG: phosphoribosylformylglycinamidine synthase subunit PurQ, partial [bacterium]
PCLFTRGLSEPIYCPVAHGEGNFIPRDEAVLTALRARGQIALTYGRQRGESGSEDESGDTLPSPSSRPPVRYPDNPNGSVADIAGICNVQGNVLGLMPHPENHIYPWQHPRWTRGERGGLGLALFQAAIRALVCSV